MNVKVSATEARSAVCDLAVFFVAEKSRKKRVSRIAGADSLLERARRAGDFRGREGEILVWYNDSGAGPARVMFCGAGKEPGDAEAVRIAAGRMALAASKTRAAKVTVAPPECALSAADLACALVEGVMLAGYRFGRYREEKEEESGRIEDLTLAFPASAGSARRGAALGRIMAHAACRARDMANEPGNVWTPEAFAAAAREIAKRHSLRLTVMGRKELEKKGMGGLLGVNQGSGKPPRLIVLEYGTEKKDAAAPLLFVGKGLTFDSGGISLKPGAGMEDMKYDMCGGACVLAVMEAAAELGLKRPLVAMIPATENLPGPDALKPGDIIRIHDGTTVEVVNTDAEGRLILADAIAYGVKKYRPAAVIDVATLTGAAIIGLGHHRTALMSNDDRLASAIISAGDRCGEPLWRLPLGKEYARQLESRVADLKNVGGKPAGTITAACFLERFVGDTPWAHLDIAGTAWDYTEKSYVPKGPSGVGVRTLIEFLRQWKGQTAA